MKYFCLTLFLFAYSFAEANVRIVAVNQDLNQITFKNFGAEENIASWRLCSNFNYTFGGMDGDATITVISGDYLLSTNEEMTVEWTPSSGFRPTGDDIGIYLPSGGFGDPAIMVDFMQYLSAGNGRESVAVAKGIWGMGDFVTGGPYAYTGDGTETGVSFWTGMVSMDGCTDDTAVNYDPAAVNDDGSCLYEVTFNVDMNCESDFTEPAVEGPLFGWCGGCAPMSDMDGDGIYSTTLELPDGDFEYKYAVDAFAGQEDLIDDMVGGASCAPVTDFFSFANRLITVSPGLVINDTYGTCGTCDPTNIQGCTDDTASNYNPAAMEDDGSCLYDVTFSVDMNCDTVTFNTVYFTGPFTSWCGNCFPLSDDDLDGVWTGTYSFGIGDLEYKYIVDNFANQEELVDDMVDGGTCAPITDFSTYANRLLPIEGVTSVEDIYGTCEDCAPGLAEDEICGAIEISVDADPILTSNAEATADGIQASCWTDGGVEADIWFSFVAPDGGIAIIETFDIGDNNDTQVAIFSSSDGSCTGELTEVACNDDISGTDYMSLVEVMGLLTGDTYYVHVDGWDGTVGEFEISVTTPLTECPEPASLICDNFDSYESGPMNGQGVHWSTWSGDLGGAEDGIVTTEESFSNNKSMLIAEGSVQDVILLLGNQTSGSWTVSWMQLVPENATAYYNLQESETPGVEWNMEVFFNEDGAAPGVGVIVGNATTFNYPEGEWFEISQTIDLENNLLTLEVDGVEVFSDFEYTGNLGAVNFYSTDGSNRYYVDDLIYDGEPVSVEELDNDMFEVFPNPSNGIFNITSKTSMDQIIVNDLLGKEVFKKSSFGRLQNEIDLSGMNKGIYLMTVQYGNQSLTKKLILQ